MRVLIVNTSERTGGAAVAAGRLTEALINNGVKAKMLVRDKETDQITVVQLNHRWLQRWRFLWERFKIFCHLRFSREHLFEIDTASSGADITGMKEFREADVIHLHWINQGMLSLNGIRKILDSGKPVVWTMHDIWPATSLCHVTLGCEKFKMACQSCPLLPGGGSPTDLSATVWKRKMQLMKHRNNIFFVACSKWLAREAEGSALLAGRKVRAIPNPMSAQLYERVPRSEARERLALPQDKQLICFIAQRATNVNKGMDYLIEACERLDEKHPDMKDKLAIVILGGQGEAFEGRFAYPIYPLGYVNEHRTMGDVYHAIDVFVTPSLSENLPNTIMEAMSCGIPCVGFNVGGIPEMIEHRKNGYVAVYKNAEDLAEGIRWTLAEADRASLSEAAVSKVKTTYSQQAVVSKYIDLYEEAMAERNYRL